MVNSKHSLQPRALPAQGQTPYRGRLAPTPSGLLHLGHARTFECAWQRARDAAGTLVMRNEDIDTQRCKAAFADAMLIDLKDYGIDWDEGPDKGGPYGPYTQSERTPHYIEAWEKLKAAGYIYPCKRSRKEIQEHTQGKQPPGRETLFPKEWRPSSSLAQDSASPAGINWRFRVPDAFKIAFEDLNLGPQTFISGVDFGDFLIWRRDGMPAYELAVTVDDAAMRISEVVRGEDLLLSTARQLLLYSALKLAPPQFYHCPLVRDSKGHRLAKRHDSLSLRKMLQEGSLIPIHKRTS